MPVKKDILEKSILEMARPLLEAEGLELVDMTVRMSRGPIQIQLYVDKTTGGINLDECAGINKALVRLLEDGQLITEPYTLDVSSPGIDRPLRTLRDFARNTGREVRLILSRLVEGKNDYTGLIESVGEDSVRIRIGDAVVDVAFMDIKHGKLVV